MVDVDIRNPQVIDESDVNGDVGIVRRRIGARESLLLPPDAEVHGEAGDNPIKLFTPIIYGFS
jgi:hypothetical protein